MENCETIIIYHGGCPDGLASAWVMSLIMDNNNTYYHAAKFDEKTPDLRGKKVIFLDFAYKLEQMQTVVDMAKEVMVLDHHVTNQQLDSIKNSKFTLYLNTKLSAAQLTWDYMCSVDHVLTTVPAKYGTYPIPEIVLDWPKIHDAINSALSLWFIEDIADRDTWKWEVVDSKHSTRGMLANNIYKNINSFYELLFADRNKYVTHGKLLNDEDARLIQNVVNSQKKVYVIHPDQQKFWRVALVECQRTFVSDVGSILCNQDDIDFAALIRYDYDTNCWFISCRSSEKKKINLLEILPLFDPKSGGHENAAGMQLPVDELKKVFRSSITNDPNKTL